MTACEASGPRLPLLESVPLRLLRHPAAMFRVALCATFILQAQAGFFDGLTKSLTDATAQLGGMMKDQLKNNPQAADFAKALQISDGSIDKAQSMLDSAMTKINTIAAEIPTIPGQMQAATDIGNTAQLDALKQRMLGLQKDLCKQIDGVNQAEKEVGDTTNSIQGVMNDLTKDVVEDAAKPEEAKIAPFMSQFKTALDKAAQVGAKAQSVSIFKGMCQQSAPAQPTQLYSSGFHVPSALMGAGLASMAIAVAFVALGGMAAFRALRRRTDTFTLVDHAC